MASPLSSFPSPSIPFSENEVKFFVVALNFAIEPVPWGGIYRDGKIVRILAFVIQDAFANLSFGYPLLTPLQH